MTLDLHTLQSIIEEVAPITTGRVLENVTLSDEHHLVLRFQNDRPIKVLLCWKQHLHRCHLIESYPPHHPTPTSKQLERRLNEALTGTTLKTISLYKNDRIIFFHLPPYQIVTQLIPGKGGLFLLDKNNTIITSTPTTKQTLYIPPETGSLPPQKTINATSAQIAAEYQTKEKAMQYTLLRHSFTQPLRNKIKKLTRTLTMLKKQITDCQKWEEMQHEGQLLQSNYHRLQRGMKSIEVEDWKKDNQKMRIPLNSLYTPQQEIEARFKKAKKWRRGIGPTQQQHDIVEQQATTLQQRLDTIEETRTAEELESLIRKWDLKAKDTEKKPKKQKSTRLPYLSFLSEKGWKLLVGRAARDNDTLTFHIANGNDYWMHVADYPGSHVVLKSPKPGIEPDQETLSDALQLALHYSKGGEDADIHITQIKYLKRLSGGVPGKVTLSTHQTRYTVRDQERLDRIRSRKL